MKTVTVADLPTQLPLYLAEGLELEPLVITRNGKPIAVVLIPLDEADLERLILAGSSRFQTLLEQSRQSLRAGQGISSDQFWQMAAK